MTDDEPFVDDSASGATFLGFSLPEPETPEEKKLWAIRGFAFFDWGKSAFETSVVVAILPAWFVYLFLSANGTSIDFGNLTLTSDVFFAISTSVAALLIAAISPALGLIADRVPIKLFMLRLLTYLGAGATCLLAVAAFLPASMGWVWLFVMFLLANVGLNGAGVFYNAILPHLGEDKEMDNISNTAYAYGYFGGGILLVFHLGLIFATGSANWALAFAMVTSGMWWYGFALLMFKYVPEPEIEDPISGLTLGSATKLAMTELRSTFNEIKTFKVLLIYMLAFFLFIDGINSVTSLAGVFGPAVLGISIIGNMIVIVLVQFIAAPAALAFTKFAERTSTKTALTAACVAWCLVIFGALGFAPLELDKHEDYDIQFVWIEAEGQYNATISSSALDVSLDDDEQSWAMKWSNVIPVKDGAAEDTLVFNYEYWLAVDHHNVASFIESIEDMRYSASVEGGPLNGMNGIGADHPTHLSDDHLGTLASWVRDNVWAPLGISVLAQWMILGLMAGCLLGGSQGLARSLFGQMVPETRSAEFFGFFGFFGKVAALLGPMIYAVIGSIWGSRPALASIAILIVLGTFLLRFVDVEEGIRVAKMIDAENRSGNSDE